jgi:hypothetical protein
MAFRANETSNSLIQDAQNYLIGRDFPKGFRQRALEDFGDLVSRCGPVVKGYPTWHPLMAACNSKHEPWTHPQNNRAYEGLDHVVLFRDAFLVCPYGGADGIIKSVRAMQDPNHFILVEELDMKLYHPDATPVLVYHEWRRPLLNDGTIPKSLAVPLMLEFELPHWRSSEVGETWETMRSYLLGSPHGQSSSLFINKEAGTVMKNVWNSLIYTGMFGPLYVG